MRWQQQRSHRRARSALRQRQRPRCVKTWHTRTHKEKRGGRRQRGGRGTTRKREREEREEPSRGTAASLFQLRFFRSTALVFSGGAQARRSRHAMGRVGRVCTPRAKGRRSSYRQNDELKGRRGMRVHLQMLCHAAFPDRLWRRR